MNDWTDKHYNFRYTLTAEDKERGTIKVDPYFVSEQWRLGRNVAPDLARVQIVALKVMDYLDLLDEDGFDEVEIVTAMFLISAKLSETLEEVEQDVPR